MSTVFGIQRRMMELGRVRFGEKGKKGEPKRLESFRLTSASRGLLVDAAKLWGGEVREWKGAPDEGYWELYTETPELPVVFPPVFARADGVPTYPFSQWYELWSGGGCLRRCDGRTESLSGGPCLCDSDKRECTITTRLSFMLPDIPGIGLWRLDTGGLNAAVELPATIEFLAAQAEEGRYVPAVLRLEQRSSKLEGVTRRFSVPVIDLPGVRVRDMLPPDSGPVAINPPVARPRERPEIPPGPEPLRSAEPIATEPEGEVPFGPPPPIPTYDDEPASIPDSSTRGGSEPTPTGSGGPVAAQAEPATAAGAVPAAVKAEAAGSTPGPSAVSPVDDLATEDDRREIFRVLNARGVAPERLKEILVELTGQDSTAAIPRSLVGVVLEAVNQAAEEVRT